MIKDRFIDTIDSNPILDADFTESLKQVIAEYPFFSTAQVLLTKAFSQQNSLLYSKQLKKAAIVANSRSVLYNYIHQPTIIEPFVAEIVPVKEEVVVAKLEVAVPVIEVKEPIKVNPITISDPEIKVVYINTVKDEPRIIASEKENIVEPIIAAKTELEIVQTIENDAYLIEDKKQEDEEKINQNYELEISKGIINSYVETDILKTNQLDKKKEDEPLDFTAWLNKVKKEAHTIQKIESVPQEIAPKIEEKAENSVVNQEKQQKVQQTKSIIDKVIDLDPGRIKLSNTKFFSSSIDAKQGLLENEHLVTETLAKIYALQGNISKAIRSYEILSLKFPQKSVYFATLIQNLKSNK